MTDARPGTGGSGDEPVRPAGRVGGRGPATTRAAVHAPAGPARRDHPVVEAAGSADPDRTAPDAGRSAARAGAAAPGATRPAGQPGAAAPAAERGTPPPDPPGERPAPASGPPAGNPPAAGPLGFGLPQVTRVMGALLGSTTVLTAILFYFGWSRAYYFYDYLGVDSSLLGLSTRDYLQLSVDGLFVPLTVAACVAIAVLWTRARLSAWHAGGRLPAAGALLMQVAGALLLVNGLSRVMVATAFNRPLAVAPLSLACGACLLVYGLRRYRSGTRLRTSDLAAAVEWAVVIILVGLSLFWAANDYSAAVGRSRAQQLVSQLPTFPDAVVYSARSLSLSGHGIRGVRCADPDAAYRFRYDGLKLVLQSGDEYLFLPARWSTGDGVAVLLPRNDSIRLEFSPAGTSNLPPAC
jgi:hypothetical protein